MRLRTAILAGALAAGALATAMPAIAADSRITSRFFKPGEIVTVQGETGIQSTIIFGPDERIENIAVGDSNAWQVTPNKRANLVFVKPMQPRARTNMTVVTDQREYLFDLVTARGQPVYLLRFTYPAAAPRPVAAAEPAVAAPAPTPPPPSPVEAALAGATPADLNFAWQPQGARRLLPMRSFDDGQSVYLAWPKDVSLPAILVREPGGIEAPVNYTVKGDYIVVDGVPPQLVLRAGKEMATLTASPRRVAPAAVATAPADPPPAAVAPDADAARAERVASATRSAGEVRMRRLMPVPASSRP